MAAGHELAAVGTTISARLAISELRLAERIAIRLPG
jgi:hypothetical protein